MFKVDENGNISCVQGDSGELVVNGIPNNKNYKLYLAIQDENRKPIGGEISVNTNGFSTVTFILTPNLTNLLQVSKYEEYAIYYYGLKLCDEQTGNEDTLNIGSNNLGDKAIITVFPKLVDGLEG